MKRSDIPFLIQLAKALDESSFKLKEFYEKRDYENFNKTKKFISQVLKKISEVAK